MKPPANWVLLARVWRGRRQHHLDHDGIEKTLVVGHDNEGAGAGMFSLPMHLTGGQQGTRDPNTEPEEAIPGHGSTTILGWNSTISPIPPAVASPARLPAADFPNAEGRVLLEPELNQIPLEGRKLKGAGAVWTARISRRARRPGSSVSEAPEAGASAPPRRSRERPGGRSEHGSAKPNKLPTPLDRRIPPGLTNLTSDVRGSMLDQPSPSLLHRDEGTLEQRLPAECPRRHIPVSPEASWTRIRPPPYLGRT